MGQLKLAWCKKCVIISWLLVKKNHCVVVGSLADDDVSRPALVGLLLTMLMTLAGSWCWWFWWLVEMKRRLKSLAPQLVLWPQLRLRYKNNVRLLLSLQIKAVKAFEVLKSVVSWFGQCPWDSLAGTHAQSGVTSFWLGALVSLGDPAGGFPGQVWATRTV